jgi:hypothetical protein
MGTEGHGTAMWRQRLEFNFLGNEMASWLFTIVENYILSYLSKNCAHLIQESTVYSIGSIIERGK